MNHHQVIRSVASTKVMQFNFQKLTKGYFEGDKIIKPEATTTIKDYYCLDKWLSEKHYDFGARNL